MSQLKGHINQQDCSCKGSSCKDCRKQKNDIKKLVFSKSTKSKKNGSDEQTSMSIATINSLLANYSGQELISMKLDDDFMGIPFFMVVTSSGNINGIKTLLDCGMDVNVSHPVSRQTALHGAASDNKLRVIRLLISYDADLNLQNSDGNTPLMLAIEAGSLEACDEIWKFRAKINLNHENKEGCTILHLAARKNMISLVADYCSAGLDVNKLSKHKNYLPLCFAIEMNSNMGCIILMKYKTDILANIHGDFFSTPVALALLQKQRDFLHDFLSMITDKSLTKYIQHVNEILENSCKDKKFDTEARSKLYKVVFGVMIRIENRGILLKTKLLSHWLMSINCCSFMPDLAVETMTQLSIILFGCFIDRHSVMRHSTENSNQLMNEFFSCQDSFSVLMNVLESYKCGKKLPDLLSTLLLPVSLSEKGWAWIVKQYHNISPIISSFRDKNYSIECRIQHMCDETKRHINSVTKNFFNRFDQIHKQKSDLNARNLIKHEIAKTNRSKQNDKKDQSGDSGLKHKNTKNHNTSIPRDQLESGDKKTNLKQEKHNVTACIKEEKNNSISKNQSASQAEEAKISSSFTNHPSVPAGESKEHCKKENSLYKESANTHEKNTYDSQNLKMKSDSNFDENIKHANDKNENLWIQKNTKSKLFQTEKNKNVSSPTECQNGSQWKKGCENDKSVYHQQSKNLTIRFENNIPNTEKNLRLKSNNSLNRNLVHKQNKNAVPYKQNNVSLLKNDDTKVLERQNISDSNAKLCCVNYITANYEKSKNLSIVSENNSNYKENNLKNKSTKNLNADFNQIHNTSEDSCRQNHNNTLKTVVANVSTSFIDKNNSESKAEENIEKNQSANYKNPINATIRPENVDNYQEKSINIKSNKIPIPRTKSSTNNEPCNLTHTTINDLRTKINAIEDKYNRINFRQNKEFTPTCNQYIKSNLNTKLSTYNDSFPAENVNPNPYSKPSFSELQTDSRPTLNKVNSNCKPNEYEKKVSPIPLLSLPCAPIKQTVKYVNYHYPPSLMGLRVRPTFSLSDSNLTSNAFLTTKENDFSTIRCFNNSFANQKQNKNSFPSDPERNIQLRQNGNIKSKQNSNEKKVAEVATQTAFLEKNENQIESKNKNYLTCSCRKEICESDTGHKNKYYDESFFSKNNYFDCISDTPRPLNETFETDFTNKSSEIGSIMPTTCSNFYLENGEMSHLLSPKQSVLPDKLVLPSISPLNNLKFCTPTNSGTNEFAMLTPDPPQPMDLTPSPRYPYGLKPNWVKQNMVFNSTDLVHKIIEFENSLKSGNNENCLIELDSQSMYRIGNLNKLSPLGNSIGESWLPKNIGLGLAVDQLLQESGENTSFTDKIEELERSFTELSIKPLNGKRQSNQFSVGKPENKCVPLKDKKSSGKKDNLLDVNIESNSRQNLSINFDSKKDKQALILPDDRDNHVEAYENNVSSSNTDFKNFNTTCCNQSKAPAEINDTYTQISTTEKLVCEPLERWSDFVTNTNGTRILNEDEITLQIVKSTYRSNRVIPSNLTLESWCSDNWQPRSLIHRAALINLSQMIPASEASQSNLIVGIADKFMLSKSVLTYMGIGAGGKEFSVCQIVQKIYRKEIGNLNKVIRWCRLKTHVNIFPFLSHFSDGLNGYIVCPLYEMTLYDHIEERRASHCSPFSVDTSRRLADGMMNGLSYLHDTLGAAHTNLSPQNLLIGHNGIIKIGYFVVNCTTDEAFTCRLGSECWRSTEWRIEKNEVEKMMSDIQVAGMIIYYIVSDGGHPFGNHNSAISKNIEKGKAKFQNFNENFSSLMTSLLGIIPANRPTAKNTVLHPWFWSDEKTLKYLLAISREISSPDKSEFCKIAERIMKNTSAFPDEKIWVNHIDPEVIKHLESIEIKLNYGKSIYDLLMFVDALALCWPSLPDKLKHDENDSAIYVTKIFPNLLPKVLEIVCLSKMNKLNSLLSFYNRT